jgi:large subunit ribosomal protein L23
MTPQEVILTPVMSEKALMNISTDTAKQSKYSFYVHPKSNRSQVKDAVEVLFGVDVMKINIANVRPKEKTLGRYRGNTSARKKATVTIKAGQRIAQLEGLGS